MKTFPLITFSFILIFAFLPSCLLPSSGQSHTTERAEWFTEARYGMFIHWGVYSGAEGVWKGEKLRYDNDYAEWIFYRNRIDKEEYLNLLSDFNWAEIDPEEWVILAKKAGMKYVTLTAKHHDGFALWDSKVGDYDVAAHTDPKRDIVAELAEACRKHGLKMGLYYSHWVDWEHPNGWDHTKEIYKISDEEYDQYWQEKVIPQMRELLTNYGDIGIIWFDMWIHHSRTIVSKAQLLQLKSMIRELQPDCLVNSRLGLSIDEDPDIDFRTLGDNQLGSIKLDYPWQSPATVAHSWGYNALENEWKSSTTLLKNLINNVSLNGNMMLNIGPRANGDVPFEIEDRLKTIGDWLEANGESIYGAGGFDLDKNQHDWCRITYKEDQGVHKIYLHISNWPLDCEVKLTGITTAPDSIYLLGSRVENDINFKHNEVVTVIELPGRQPDPLVSVVVLEYSNYPDVKKGLVAESMSNGYSFTPYNCSNFEDTPTILRPEKFGSIPAHAVIESPAIYTWKVFFDEPVELNLDASYSFLGESGSGEIKIRINGEEYSSSLNHTGLTVGEPGQKWQIQSFNSHFLGVVDIQEAGYYDIELELIPDDDDPVGFQWVWLGR